jgi:hypothetical protein
MDLTTGEQLASARDRMAAARAKYETYWREAYDYTDPILGEGFSQGTGSISVSSSRSKQAKIYDSTLADAVDLLSASLVSGLIPASAVWFGWDEETPAGQPENTQNAAQLDDMAKAVWGNLHASGITEECLDYFRHYAIAGMAALYVEPGDEERPYKIELWPLSSILVASSKRNGPIDIVYRDYCLTGLQALNEFGDTLPDRIRGKAEKEPDTEIEFCHCIYPRSNPSALELPIASIHYEKSTKKVVRNSGYEELPVFVSRYNRIPGSAYALGAVAKVLPDTRTLNETVKLTLENMDMAVAGMWGAVNDGVINPKAVSVGARKVVMMAAKDNMWPMAPAGSFQAGDLQIDRLQTAIRRGMMADQLQPQEGPNMTAYEVHIRTQLIRQLLGPRYERVQSDLLSRLVYRCLMISIRAGKIIPPDGEVVARIKYLSPLAKAAMVESVQAMDRMEASLGTMAPIKPEILDNYDWDAAARERGKYLGVPAKLIPDEKVIAQMREQRAQQQAQQQQQMQQDGERQMMLQAAAKGGGNAA